MTQTDETQEPTEPQVTDVPEPDQEPHEPIPDEADDDEEQAEADESLPFEPPAEEEQPQEAQQEEWEKRFTAAERKFQTYVRAVTNIWEEDAVHLHPISVGTAAPPGFIDIREAGRVPDEVKIPILEFFGIVREQDYESDPYADECSVCKGKGKTRLPTKVAGKESRTCHTCKGFGFIDKTPGSVGTVTSTAAQATNGHVEDAPLTREDVDNWGQPKILPDGRENPNWGRTPDYWVQVPPWGDTRNLNVGGPV